jgi:hypothetical protein
MLRFQGEARLRCYEPAPDPQNLVSLNHCVDFRMPVGEYSSKKVAFGMEVLLLLGSANLESLEDEVNKFADEAKAR